MEEDAGLTWLDEAGGVGLLQDCPTDFWVL